MELTIQNNHRKKYIAFTFLFLNYIMFHTQGLYPNHKSDLITLMETNISKEKEHIKIRQIHKRNILF